MRITFLSLLMLLASQPILAQNATQKTLTYSVSPDTTMKPDYFNIEIAVAEYVRYEGSGKKSKAILVPLDTVSQNLITELKRIGFRQPLEKSSIVEKSSRSYGDRVYFDGRLLFQVAYQFNISSKDSVTHLFKEIGKENLVSFIVTPKFYNQTLEKAKEKLIAEAMGSIKDYAQKIADSNNFKVIKQTNINLGFWPKQNNSVNKYNAYGGQKEFIIDLSDVEYVLNAIYTYTYEDK